MFLLEKIITNEKEHLKYIEEIHKFENIQYDGLLCIDKWVLKQIVWLDIWYGNRSTIK